MPFVFEPTSNGGAPLQAETRYAPVVDSRGAIACARPRPTDCQRSGWTAVIALAGEAVEHGSRTE